ncbi:hypothetical protein IKE71_02195 [Candidatus Saccharibacteria bacterium]|nr:hypothetical protein [Candidatus Saccharibacteria bacterium]
MNLAKFFDDFAIAGRGVLLATRRKDFWTAFLATFFIFGTLLNLLSNGTTGFMLLLHGNFEILGKAVVANFGVGKEALDFMVNFILTVFQAVLVGLVVIVYKHNREGVSAGAGIAAGLMVLGSGCPTCGTTLLTPVVATIFSGATGAVGAAGTVSMVLNILAIVVAILVFRKLGTEVYAIIVSEKFRKKGEVEKNEKSR